MTRILIFIASAALLASCSSSSFYSGKAEDGVYSTVYAPSYTESTGTTENTVTDPYTGNDDYVTSPYGEPSRNPYQPNYNYWDQLYFNLGPYYNPYSFNPGFGGGFVNPYDPYFGGGWNSGWNSSFGWNSWNGWNAGIGYGMGWGMNPWTMNSWGMNPWMSPWQMNPWMNPWAMNGWGNPYWSQANPYWNNWGYGFNDGGNNFYYGPRTSMASTDGTNSGTLYRNRVADEIAPPYLSPERTPSYRPRTPNPEVNTPNIPNQRNPQETENERGSFWNSFIPGQTTPRERTPNTNERSPRVNPPSGTTPSQRTPRYSPPSNNTPRQRTPNYSPPSNNTPRQRSGGGANNSRRRP